jgi:Ca2+-binding RTX toxin-like protein
MGNYTGTSGDDTFLGSGGADTMTGLAGNDVYYVDDAADVVIEAAGEGNDRIAASVSYVLAANAEVELIEAITLSATNPLDLTGSSFANTIYGNEGVNFLRGQGGDDRLFGFGGDDFLIGGTGVDLMVGGAGNDTYYVDDTSDAISEAAGEGNDRVAASISLALAPDADIERIEAVNLTATVAMDLTGSDIANTVYGNDGVNILRGQSGDDTLAGFGGDDFLVGGVGIDLMTGGLGNDTFYVDDAGDVAFEAAGEGTDRIAASVSYTLSNGSDIELLEAVNLTATVAFDLTGSDSANTIIGNDGVNVLKGQGGNDVLIAAGGDDFLVGGTGTDTMYGGLGNDTYYVDSAGDAVNETTGEGSDRVAASVSYALAAGSEVETLEAVNGADTTAMDLTGNGLANAIIGNAGANILNGGVGNDVLTGLGGADSFAFTTLGAGNVDTIVDFLPGTDKILLAGGNGEPFAVLAAGTLVFDAFRNGTAAADANDYIIYNSATGALLFDADGNGAGAAVQFATVTPGLVLHANDIFVSGPLNNTPVFTSGGTASVAENSAASTIVYQASATDADGDRITYSLTGADALSLTIDPLTGAVRLINPADFESKASYSFNVLASDSGNAGTAGKSVVLSITDVLDSGVINENGSNDTIGNAQAIDRNTFTVAPNGNLYNPNLPSATIVGSVSVPGDRDFFSITLQAGEQLILDVDFTRNNSDPSLSLDSFLTIYGPNQAAIGDNDDQQSFDPGSQPGIASHNTDSQIIFRAATSGTYYFSIESFNDDDGPTSSGAYQLNVSIGPPATPQQLVQEDIQALISGDSWNHPNLTFGFPTLASQYPGSFPEANDGFTPFTASQQAATRLLLQIVGTVTPLTFTELVANPGQADLRYAMSNLPDVAYAYYPTNDGPSSRGGSAWFNHTSFNNPVQGRYAWMGILHETGHALGLKHGHEFPLAISADRDSVEYSVMTYRSFPGQDLSGGGGYSNETNSYPQTLMMYDIAALQQIYGANYGFNATDSVYTWAPGSGQTLINGAPAISPGGDRIFLTVWDGGGNDTYDLSAYSTGTTIDLRPGEWTITSTTQIANLGQGHMARGNVANALLFQGNAASLIENAIGGTGQDTIIANQAANHLAGNGGNDTFKWMASGDAGTGALADTITDFVQGAERIDLSAIDSIPGTGNNDAFTFLGTGAFTNNAGQLRYDVTGGHAHIFADLDGNGVADMEIILSNVTTLVGSDFIL